MVQRRIYRPPYGPSGGSRVIRPTVPGCHHAHTASTGARRDQRTSGNGTDERTGRAPGGAEAAADDESDESDEHHEDGDDGDDCDDNDASDINGQAGGG